MLTRASAQELVDGLTAIALAASVLALVRQGATSPLRARLGFAFGGAVLFFAARAASVALDSTALAHAALIVVTALPIGALVLGEGVLRRHAPRALKIAIALGAPALAFTLVVTHGARPVSSWWLGGYVVASLASVTVLLLARDQTSLSRQENASVDGLITAGAVLTALSATDFLERAPVGLSGIGAATVAFIITANPTSGPERRRALIDLLAIVTIAGLSALAFAAPLGLANPQTQLRLGAVLLALLLVVAAILAGRRRGAGQRARSLANALAAADTASLDGFLSSLADQPLLAGLRLAEAKLLDEYDTSGLAAAMAARAVWTGAVLTDALPARARDELADLMLRAEATHALMVSAAPLRIALLTLPGVGASDDAETNLALFGKIAAIAAANHP